MPVSFERPVRIQARELCTIVRQGGELVGAVLVDLSDAGFCVEGLHSFAVGERIELRLRGLGRMPGFIRWSDSGRAGGVLEPYSQGACGEF